MRIVTVPYNQDISINRKQNKEEFKLQARDNILTRGFFFTDDSGSKTQSMNWPRLERAYDSSEYEQSSLTMELARKLIFYLKEIGITSSSLEDRDFSLPEVIDFYPGEKMYDCKLDFSLTYGDENFSVSLWLMYQTKEKTYHPPPYAFISKDQLLNYLKEKIILRVDNEAIRQFEIKLKSLLSLVVLRCTINDFHVEI
ncbi:hypothetical protein G9P44_004518 [Scheffersomyces stipitis]|nr:hypothetical protein G9P44_004518 [Scheffersomyces stipitis]